MKKLILSLLLLPVVSFASGNVHLDHADVDISDKASMQRGLKYVTNYCLGCHSMAYSRYNRVGLDLGISDELMQTHIISTRDKAGDPSKVGSLMKTSMSKGYAKEAFGTVPPDLSLTARSRGSDWVYSYFCVAFMSMTLVLLASITPYSRMWVCLMCCGECRECRLRRPLKVMMEKKVMVRWSLKQVMAQ